jgi:hypothetical protein
VQRAIPGRTKDQAFDGNTCSEKISSGTARKGERRSALDKESVVGSVDDEWTARIGSVLTSLYATPVNRFPEVLAVCHEHRKCVRAHFRNANVLFVGPPSV